MDQTKKGLSDKPPLETYKIYKHAGAQPPQEEIRSTKPLSDDEYYELYEDDRIIPEENNS
ncbi:hypothetical protein [Ammoniphilus sp. 3BR4]|uniref:hypothetical protein n=1 Tax=Ammoniphilus sp. 3BR4 TaxID=3158265 RepID=UPI003467E3B7